MNCFSFCRRCYRDGYEDYWFAHDHCPRCIWRSGQLVIPLVIITVAITVIAWLFPVS